MPTHDYMRHQVKPFGYLEKGIIQTMMELSMKQEEIEQICFLVPKAHQQKQAEMHKMLPGEHVPLICFFEQCQNADCTGGILD